MLTQDVKRINDGLTKEFGFVIDKPKFRVVWTGDQLEKRLAKYEDVDKSGILIRIIEEVREVPKYPYVRPDWWMIERRMQQEADPSIKNWNGYEPLYLFRHFDEKGNYGEFLPPRLDMAIVACKLSMAKRPKRTYAMDKSDFEAKEAKAEQDIFEQVKDMTSDLGHLFHHREAVILDGKSDLFGPSPNLVSKE